ncbi:MAG: hypothetical protein QG650_918 [Patescibacteria group bacterium]|nr:hypothetical protein [Patescibacteria group bacterium]
MSDKSEILSVPGASVERAKESMPDIDSLLSRLEGSAAKTEVKAEKDGIKGVIDHIKELKAGRAEAFSKDLEGLRTSLSETDRRTIATSLGDVSLAEKLGVKDVVAKASEPAKRTISEVADTGKEAIEKYRKGDVQGAKAAAKEAIEQGKAAGDAGIAKAKEIGFVAAINEGIGRFIEWIKNIFRAIVGFFAPDAAKKLFGDGKEEGVTTADKKAETAAAAKEAPLEKALGERKKRFMETLSREYHVDFTDPAKNRKFETIWKKYMDDSKGTAKDLAENFRDDKTYHLADYPLRYGKDSLSFVYELVDAGIIPKDAIRMWFVDGTKKTVAFGLSIGKELISLNGVEEVLGQLSVEELGKKYSEMGSNEKQLLAYTIQHKFAPLAYLTGIAAGAATSLLIAYPTWKEGVALGTSVNAAKTVFAGFDQAAKSIEEVYAIIGGKNASFSAELLRKMMRESYTKLHVTEFARSSKNAGEFADGLAKIRGTVPAEMLDADLLKKFETAVTDRAAPISSLRGSVQQLIETDHTKTARLNFMERVKGTAERSVKGYYADSSIYIDDVVRQRGVVDKALSASVAESKNSIGSIITKLRAVGKFTSLPGVAQKAAFSVHADSVEEFKKVASGIAKESPHLFESFFANVAVVVSGVAAYESWKSGTNAPTAILRSLAGLTPFFGAGIMFYEGTEMEGGLPTKPFYIMTGVGMLAVDAWQLAKLAASGARASEYLAYFGRPITLSAKFALGSVRTVYETGKTVSGIARAGSVSTEAAAELRGLGFRFAGVGAVLAVSILAGRIAYDSYREGEDEKLLADLKKDGFFDESGNPIPAKVTEAFRQLPKEKQEILVKIAAASSLGGEKREFDVRQAGSGWKLTIQDRITDTEVPNLIAAFKENGLPVDVHYAEKTIRTLAATFKAEGYGKDMFVRRMKELGVADPEKFFA